MTATPAAAPAVAGEDNDGHLPAAEIAAAVRRDVDAGRLQAALERAHRALARAVGADRARLLLAQSYAYVGNGRYLESLRCCGEAADIFRQTGLARDACEALILIGATLRAAGDHTAAIRTFEQAEVQCRELGDPALLSLLLRHLGICCSVLGRHRQALADLAEAVDLAHACGDQAGVLSTRLSLLNARSRQAVRWDTDSDARQQALLALVDEWSRLAADADAAGKPRLELMVRGNRAIALRDLGRHQEAIDELDRLLPRYRERGMRPNEAICHEHLGAACQSLGRHEQARAHLLHALDLHGPDGSADELRDCLEGLSHAHEALGEYREALTALRRVREIERGKDDAQARDEAATRELRLEATRLTSHWRQLATIDALTGLRNRHGMEQWLAHWNAGAGEPLTLLLLDVDRFKSINDRFGHAVGDAVLRVIGELLQANCRAGDMAVRYGGEEFLLGLISVAPSSAPEIADRLRMSIAAHTWSALADGLTVTASIGVAASTETGNVDALFELADRRLYAAKFGGRDRVISAGVG